MKRNIFLLALLALGFAGCSDDDSTPAPAPTSGSGTITTPSAFQMASNALTSITSTFPTATCDAQGAPTTTAGSATFASDRFYCSFNAPSNQLNSLRADYSKAAGLLCAAQAATTFSNSATPTVHDNLTLSESSDCYEGGVFDANNDGDTSDTFVASIREGALTGTDFEKKTEIQLNKTAFDTAATSDYVVWTKNTDAVSAAKSFSTGSVSEVKFDKTTNEMFLENRDYANSIHDRVYAKGTINGSTGTVTSLTNLKAIEATGNAGSENNSVLFATDGTNKLFDHFVGTTQAPGYEQCTGDCTSLTIPYDASFHDFSGTAQSTYNTDTMMDTTTPFSMSF
jgi:hypothetical protein